MPKRRGYLPSRLSILEHVAGRGLPERMRSASVALLGVTAAISMAFVAVIAQQGWTVFPLGPIPGLPAGAQGVGEGTALGSGSGAGAGRAQARPATLVEPPFVARAPRAPRPATGRPGGAISGSQALALAPAESPASEPGSAGAEPAPPTGTGTPAQQPSSAGSSPTTASPGESGRTTAAVKQQEADQEREEEEAAQAESGQPSSAPPENSQQVADEEAEEAASAPPWGEGHGHGWGHHHG